MNETRLERTYADNQLKRFKIKNVEIYRGDRLKFMKC